MVRLITSPQQRTGPGPARNRGVAAARGAFLAYLDADDSWSPGYLAALLPLARHEGCAFAATVVETPDGEALASSPRHARRLMLPDLPVGARLSTRSTPPGCHGAGRRSILERPAQDVMHAVEVFMACGYRRAGDQRRLSSAAGAETVTTASDFSSRLSAAYAPTTGRWRRPGRRRSSLGRAP